MLFIVGWAGGAPKSGYLAAVALAPVRACAVDSRAKELASLKPLPSLWHAERDLFHKRMLENQSQPEMLLLVGLCVVTFISLEPFLGELSPVTRLKHPSLVQFPHVRCATVVMAAPARCQMGVLRVPGRID